ncbi:MULTISPECIES: threonine synthase [unclassified Mesorhizobium]|uniref:threonine synthase n=1 Tax=unclassified Mesorhizobium TaxID=325217 RepID=UPI001CCA6783|nr:MULTISPECIES: threonine synthase [unclassified Mesorhizobium]MBZ9921924.1 threonine synthase [Mesorhizobium sp. BR1-1-7]MBZ9965895.1 threonine synthase [Mesorhizobium sp. BR1-1-2]
MSKVAGYTCIRCRAAFPADLKIDSRGCPHCRADAPANLEVIYAPAGNGVAVDRLSRTSPPSLWRYADRLPCRENDAISLGEGLTPLLPAETLGERLGVPRLLIKDEGANPTWSHKDRFSTVAVSMARLTGARVVATASSGNAGASLAAYAARAGLKCVVVTFAGTAGAMLTQVRKYGATVVPMADKSLRWPFLASAVDQFDWYVTSPFHAPVVGSHPVGLEGYKTLAYEICEQMEGAAPDWCALPVCYGDALAGIWLGFKDLFERGVIERLPRLVAAEVHGSLTRTLDSDRDAIIDAPSAFDTLAISIGTTRSTFQALQALRQSRGTAVAIDNDGLIEMQEQLAACEGIFAELASVTPLAAIGSLRRRGVIGASDRVVAITTASGLKDLDRSTASVSAPQSFQSVDDAWQHLRKNMQDRTVGKDAG